MEETLRNHLLSLGREFERVTKTTLASVGKRALNDNTVFVRLESGASGFNVRTYDRLLSWFADRWPADAVWPSDVPHPLRACREDGACSPQ